MLFSIIIPTYNLEKYIQKTLDSIMQNDLSDSELILVDDGSTDKTVENAEAILKQKCLCNYRIIKKENTGVSDTRNKGIEKAEGKYVIFCDGDDFFETDLLSVLSKQLQEEPDMAAWPYYIMDEKKKIVSQDKGEDRVYTSMEMLRRHLLEGYRFRLGSFAVKRECLIKNGINFNVECSFAEDMEFIMKCLLSTESVQWIHKPLFCYVKRKGSLVNSFNMRRFEASRAIGRVGKYIDKKEIYVDEDVKEYIENGLFILHYIYSIEACLQSISTRKEAEQLWTAIEHQYGDVEDQSREKLRNMKKTPYGISKKRMILLKLGTKPYIRIRLWQKGRTS